MNLFIEKIMNTNKNWESLQIFGNLDEREIFISSIPYDISGVENNKGSSVIYFNNIDTHKFNKILEDSSIAKWQWSTIKEENWVQQCKDFFQPVIINNKIQIIPHWMKINSEFINIKINPALAFGTGHHETTYMMIQAMLRFNLKNKTIFDIGTGSGILSILAHQLGADKIYAIDNDELTNNNFYENLALNDIKEIRFDVKSCFDINNFNYDFIFANINLNVLLELIPNINTTGTIMFISGILDSDKIKLVEILERYNKKIKDIFQKKEWLCFIVEL